MTSVDTGLEELMSHLGEFGKYQARQYVLHILSSVTSGMHMLSLIMVAAVPAHRCEIPANVSSDFASPADLFDSTVSDRRNTSVFSDDLPRGIDSCHYLDRDNVTRECTFWTYDTTHFQSSRGMEWNFVCSRRWMGAAAQSSYMFGMLASAVILGSMADTYGRKIIFYVSAVAQLVLGVSVALVNSYYVFLAIRFLYGIFGAGAILTGFVLTMELVGPTKRSLCGMLYHSVFVASFILVAVWGAVVKNRMWLQIVYGMHSAILLGHWWLMDESPRWLWAHSRAAEAIAVVQKGLRVNGSNVLLDAAKLISRSKTRRETKEERSYSALDLFRSPNLRKKSLIICFIWFSNSIAYYGLIFNTENLVGNPFLMLSLTGLVELPAHIFLIFVMDRAGRRCLVSTFMIIAGACCVCVAGISSISGSNFANVATIIIALVGKACIAASFAVVYNYTAELFPTVVRNTAVGTSAMCECVSNTLTPMIFLLDSFDARVPVVLFGLVALMASFLAFCLPETMNQPMLETLEDEENFGKGDTCFTTCIGGKTKASSVATEREEKEKLNDV